MSPKNRTFQTSYEAEVDSYKLPDANREVKSRQEFGIGMILHQTLLKVVSNECAPERIIRQFEAAKALSVK